MAVQFEPLASFRAAHIGILWKKFAKEFPLLEDHNQIPSKIETFGGPVEPSISISLTQQDTPPPIRTWFLNEAGTELIQVQNDRFIHNWRKRGERVQGDPEYPRYEKIRSRFQKELRIFERFLAEYSLGKPEYTQVELGYYNHVDRLNVWKTHGEINKVYSIFTRPKTIIPDMDFESCEFNIRHIIRDDEGPIGRLYISSKPVFYKKDDTPLYYFSLIARGMPRKKTKRAIFQFMDRGREAIVLGFTSLTTSAMHKAWERI